MLIEVAWKVTGETLPHEHGYALWTALVEKGIVQHDGDEDVQVLPIRGEDVGGGFFRLTGESEIAIRVPCPRGIQLLASDHRGMVCCKSVLRLHGPVLRKLTPSERLWSPLVTMKNVHDARELRRRCEWHLQQLGVRGSVSVGAPSQTRIQDHPIRGFQVTIGGLSEADSLRLQADAIGGRRHFGCGVLMPC